MSRSALESAFQDPLRWLDLGLGRLQDGGPAWCWPAREGLAEVAVVGVFGGDHQALPVGQLVGERVALGGQVLDPLGRSPGSAPPRSG